MKLNEIKSALGSAGSKSNIWNAVMSVLEQDRQYSVQAVMAPDLTSEARHYNAGRAANITDLIDQFVKLMEDAEHPKGG